VERLPTSNAGDDEMKTTIDMAREVYGAHTEWSGAPLDRLEQLVALVRADQREIDAKECNFDRTSADIEIAIRARKD
jgi:hypothetical protein